MGKPPAFQFYVGDYYQDTRCLSLEARGAWTDCLIFMWRSDTRGEITYTLIEYARIFGCSEEQAERVISELIERQICDCFFDDARDERVTLERNANVTRVTLRDKNVTLRNRRMYREAQTAQTHASRQFKHRQRKAENKDDARSDGEVTHPSSSSSSSSKTTKLTPANNSNHAGNQSGEKASRAVARSARPPNEFSDRFCELYRIRFPDELAYSPKQGDFVQLAKLKGEDKGGWLTIERWDRALGNFFASELGEFTLADFAVRFKTFFRSAIDRYGKPVIRNGTPDVKPSTTTKRLQQTAERWATEDKKNRADSGQEQVRDGTLRLRR